jgi:hypothetical protein
MIQTKGIGQRLLEGSLLWPDSWKCDQADIPIGTNILNVMTPFLESLAASGLSETTLRRHFYNIWLLGGEIIRESSRDSTLRSISGFNLVMYFIGHNGGPLSLHNVTESEQRAFESSCRKLYHFLFTNSSKNKRTHP